MDADKATALAAIKNLVSKFRANEADYTSAAYNETQARTDFISPLLEALGWDVSNQKHLPTSRREVVEEANVSIADDASTRRPDYELRLAGIRKLFVEAKKPSVNLAIETKAAFQARRYGFSARMPIVVLTNFRQLAIYGCTEPPLETDNTAVAMIDFFSLDDLQTRFEELWNYFSREVVFSGDFDERYQTYPAFRGTAPFDELFLGQVRTWREMLAKEIFSHAAGLTAAQLTYAVQVFLSRLIFLRICEDRDIEKYEQLRDVIRTGGGAKFSELLKRADEFYDSGLFDVMRDTSLGTVVDEHVVKTIVEELYYPKSPYTFSVVEPEVLARIYEQFLGEEIAIKGTSVSVIQRPEVRESGGVVPTPRDVVDEIVDRTLSPLLTGKSPADIQDLTVLDMCCGSGVFLLSAYERICDFYLDWYLKDGPEKHNGAELVEAPGDSWRLSYTTRRLVLLRHIRGVDIDPDAVEVAQLSLLLKLIEGESRADLNAFVKQTGGPALPVLSGILKSGNSLVSRNEWDGVMGGMASTIADRVRPFDWQYEFPAENAHGGFTVIVGNPPYIRIQNMAKYSPEEVHYYEDGRSPYRSAHQNNFDKYALFIERGIDLLQEDGRLGFIVPHKFMTTTAGDSVRAILADRVSELIHFGSEQVFPGAWNYTAIVIIGPPTDSPLVVEPVSSIAAWRRGEHQKELQIARDTLSNERWRLGGTDLPELVQRLMDEGAQRLDEVADIFVGLQTSADNIYIVEVVEETDVASHIRSGGEEWILEKELLRPCLLDVGIEPFQQPSANRRILFPYHFVEGVPHLIQPEEMRANYPGCWSYLERHKAALERRSITGGIEAEKQWYQFGRSQSLNKMNGPKILLPILSLESRYAPDRLDICMTGGGNGPYYLIRPKDKGLSIEALLGILNHPLSESIVRSHTSVFRGGYYSHGKQFIRDIPIPALSAVKAELLFELEQEVEAAGIALRGAKTPDEEAQAARRLRAARTSLAKAVDDIYELTDADRLVIASVPMP
jgi:hypothetical protein